jgi:probable F420-dependent oxidoreductase
MTGVTMTGVAMTGAVRPFEFAFQMRALRDPAEIAATAGAAELLGYRQLFSFDHIGTVDPFVPMVVAAAAAPTVGVGPLVLNNELHHPALLARTAATVDAMTGGRLVLGLGTGYDQREHDAIGVPLNAPGARVRRFEESLTVLRRLLDDDVVAFDGAFHHVHVESLGIRPTQAHVPFLIGGHGRRVVDLAGRFADVFQFTGLTHRPDGTIELSGFGVDELGRRADWLREAAGDRDPEIVRSALVQALHIGPDATDRTDEVANEFGVTPQIVHESPFILLGSVDQVVDKLHRLRERLGISHYVVRDIEQFAPVVDALSGR